MQMMLAYELEDKLMSCHVLVLILLFFCLYM
jgi:hypothetical protein